MSLAFFKDYLRREKLEDLVEPFESGETAKTAEGAALSIGCEVSQIVKSLVVTADGRYYVFLVPGNERLNLGLLSSVLPGEARMATADEVKSATGYSIGGVPPFGHKEKLKTYIIPGFSTDKPLYAAAGDNAQTFEIPYVDLVRLTSAEEFNI